MGCSLSRTLAVVLGIVTLCILGTAAVTAVGVADGDSDTVSVQIEGTESQLTALSNNSITAESASASIDGEYDRSFTFDQVGDPVWQGQYVRVTQVGSENTVSVYTADDDGNPDAFQFQQSAQSKNGGQVILNTSVLEDEDHVLQIEETEETSSTFLIRQHDLETFSIDRDRAALEQPATLEMQSNRVDYDLLLTEIEQDLSSDELATVFDEDEFDRFELSDDRDALRVGFDDSVADVTMRFDQLSPGNYTFQADGADSTATATDDIEVLEEPLIEFDSQSYVVDRGDVQTFTVEMDGTDQGVVRVADSEETYFGNLIVEPNEDGEATIQWNTYRAGQGTPEAAFTATDGEVVDAEEWEIPEESWAQRIIEDDYDLTAYALDEKTEDISEIDIDELNAIDIAVAFLLAPDERVSDATTMTAPEGSIDTESDGPEAIREVTTQTGDIAAEDYLVVQYDATGVYGYLVNDSGAYIGSAEGLDLQITVDSKYANTLELTPDDDGVDIITAPEDNEFFLVVDTAEIDDEDDVSSGTSLNTTFEITEDNDYVEEDGDEAITAESVLLDRVVEVTGVFEEDTLQVPNSPATDITAQTTVAPGSEIFIRARARSPDPFLEDDTVIVDEDRVATATFDFSEKPIQQSFSVTARDLAGDAEETVDAQFTEAVVDRQDLDGLEFWCCDPVPVAGFDAGEAVDVVTMPSGETADELTADDSGQVQIQPANLSAGTYALTDESDTAYGTFEISRQSIDRFETDRSSVSQGAAVELRVESDRDEFALELFEASGEVHDRTIAVAVDEAYYQAAGDRTLLPVEDGELTTSIDTSELPPGTYEFATAPIDATTGATTSLEVTGERPPALQTYVAPADAVEPEDSPATVAENLTQRDTVALQDVAAVTFEDGLDDDATILLERRGSHGTWMLDDDALARHDDDSQTIVTVDTEALGRSGWATAGYDLVVETDGESAVGSFTVEPRWVSTVAPSDDGALLYPTAETTITAETNAAPGSEIFLRARASSEDPFLEDTTVTVDEDGLAQGDFDFTDRTLGTEFRVTTQDPTGGAEVASTARFVDGPDGVDRRDLTTVPAGEATTISGFAPRESVTVWRLEDGDRDELVGQAPVDDDGRLELHPGLTESGESYALVDDSGSRVSTVTTVRSSVEPYVNGEGVVETDGLIQAVDDWADGAIETELLSEIIEFWQSEAPVGQ